MIRQESHKLSLLDSRLDLYSTVLQHVTEVAFNDIQLATDHTRKFEPKVKRAIVTFKQAKMPVDAVSLDEIHKNKKLIVDISTMRPWNKSLQCYLMLDVFRSGTMEVEKRKFCTQYVQVKYFEPLHVSSQDQCVHAQNYASMLHNLMDTIQNYILLNDNDKERGALTSLEIVDSTAQVREDNRSCIWLEDVQTRC